jgi:hypothetical protein
MAGRPLSTSEALFTITSQTPLKGNTLIFLSREGGIEAGLPRFTEIDSPVQLSC